jgi:ribosomal protein L11 methyltransferase
MNYCELLFTTIITDDYQQDLLMNELAEFGFDTFEEMDFGFKAYIPADQFNKKALDEILQPYHQMFTFSYEVTLIPHKNWNEIWETNFEPIEIKDQIYVRATFHPATPDFKYEIVIDPKMAFGTGHHQTTSMMMDYMLETDYQDKTVLDMGCGTGILAILASKMGATSVTAIDFDEVCYESTLENAPLNHIGNIIAICGSKEDIADYEYDIILANINRNILVEQMGRYAEVLKPDGEIYFSGFYEEPDLDIIVEEARKYDLKYISHKENKKWVAVKMVK